MNKVIQVYDKIASRYFECRENLALWPELEYFMMNLPEDGLILDAGCGNGRDLKIFSEHGYKSVGVDASCEQLKFAKSRDYSNKVDIINCDLRTFASTNKFDGIWCNAVFPHFSNEDILNILKLFNTLLSDNGLILATFKKGIGERMVEEPEFNNIARYTNFHEESDIRNFALHAQLNLIDIHYYNERKRFYDYNRDLNFIVAVFKH